MNELDRARLMADPVRTWKRLVDFADEFQEREALIWAAFVHAMRAELLEDDRDANHEQRWLNFDALAERNKDLAAARRERDELRARLDEAAQELSEARADVERMRLPERVRETLYEAMRNTFDLHRAEHYPWMKQALAYLGKDVK